MLLIIISNFISSYFLTKILIKPFKKYIPDEPNERSAHLDVKARGGGLVFIFSNLITSFFLGNNNFLILLPLSFVSFLDDIIGIRRSFRFITQITTCVFIFLNSTLFPFLINGDNLILDLIITFSVIIISTAIINFCNFIDGIDGILSGFILVFLIAASSLITGSIWGIFGAILGFIIWNWSPSKIFMGDIGSNFLGGLIVWILLNTNNLNDSLALLIISFPILIDPIVCLIRRLINHQNIFEAHSLHLYQRLTKSGLNHSSVAFIYISSALFISLAYFIGGLKLEIVASIIIFIIGIWLEKNIAFSFK